MKITKFQYDKMKIQLIQPLRVAFAVVEYLESIILKIETDEGIIGYGEAAPFAPVTGETLDSVPVALDIFEKALVGSDPMNIENAHAVMNQLLIRNSAAKAAVDIALHDIKGKSAGMPLYQLLGGYSSSIESDITLGIDTPSEMAKKAKHYVDTGYTILKIKAGIDYKEDIESVACIRTAVGENIRLRIDANQGWNRKDALKMYAELEKYGIEAIEQPLPYWDIEGIAYLTKNTKIKTMIDESLHSPYDAMRAVKKEVADIFNIKLMKSSGIHPALKINAIGESAGIPCMVGCMGETRIAIAAGAHLVAATKNITEADLDSYVYFKDNGSITGGFVQEGSTITLLNKPGLGIDINF